MSRKRFVTSEISTDKKVAALAEDNPTAALMWPWFTTAFDDWGRMGADPMEVKLTVFPAFPFTSKDVAEAIRLINYHGLAHYYEVDGKPYLSVNPSTWYKYQTYIKSERKEKQASKYPEPVDAPWQVKKSAIIADNQQQLAAIVPSPSPSPSPSKDQDIYIGQQNNGEDAEKETSKEKTTVPYREIVDYLNLKAGTGYKHNAKTTKDKIKARWNEGYKLDDFKIVIDNKVTDWLGDKEYQKYLRPETLFGTKFEGYLNSPRKDSGGDEFDWLDVSKFNKFSGDTEFTDEDLPPM